MRASTVIALVGALLIATIVGYGVGLSFISRASDSSQSRLNDLEAHLVLSTVVAGTYGSITAVPVMTVDASGLILDATTVTASDTAVATTYVTRDANASSALAGVTLGGTSANALYFIQDTTAAGGANFGGDISLYRSGVGTLKTDGKMVAKHYYTSSGSIPTAVAGTGAGSSPTLTVTAGSTDCKMQLTVLTGSTPTATGIIATITYNYPFTNTLNKGVIFCDASSTASALAVGARPFVTTEALSSFVFNSGGTALGATTTYVWNFQMC